MIRRENAERLAAQLLDWLASEPDRIGAFLAQTGVTPGDLRQHAAAPETLLAVLDFVLADEGRLLAACRDLNLPPALPARARAALPGGDEVHWT